MPSQRHALGALFFLLMLGFVGIAFSAVRAGYWIVGLPAAALGYWMATMSLKLLRRH